MKSIIFSLFLFVSITASAQTFNTPLEYLEFVSEQQEGITKRMWKYTKAIAHSKSDRNINNKRNSLIKTLDKAISKIKKAPSYKGHVFKKQLLDRLVFNKNLLNNDYAKIIDMKAVAEQSYDAMEAYMLAQELADQKMKETQDEYEKNYNAFAAEHNIKIIETENELGKKMEISNEVFKYYKEMYLIYFKVYINEIYLLDAFNANDVNGIQQNANALAESAKEGIDILEKTVHYKNDNVVANATKKSFEFFIEEAEQKIPELIEFFILKEDLDKSQKTLEKTPAKKRTKEQIDAYNNLVNSFNDKVKSFNNTNNSLNEKRSKIINALNKANQILLSKHIPND